MNNNCTLKKGEEKIFTAAGENIKIKLTIKYLVANNEDLFVTNLIIQKLSSHRGENFPEVIIISKESLDILAIFPWFNNQARNILRVLFNQEEMEEKTTSDAISHITKNIEFLTKITPQS